MPQSPNKYRWLGSYAIGILLLFVPEAFFVGHFILKLTIAMMMEPIAVFAGIFLAAGPFLYKSRTRARENGDARAMVATVTLFLSASAVTCFYFGASFGVVSVEAARGYILTSVILTPIWGGIAM